MLAGKERESGSSYDGNGWMDVWMPRKKGPFPSPWVTLHPRNEILSRYLSYTHVDALLGGICFAVQSYILPFLSPSLSL
ncbi:unnamed protein product [Periconia digitata]|uniref:Uncharacterized protein n=1 Tax=Periconia digitata TaxID=1303443 RepID=A0A9W4U1P9_9PLEO|nr:unnamed protein product [Periconia digitata]